MFRERAPNDYLWKNSTGKYDNVVEHFFQKSTIQNAFLFTFELSFDRVRRNGPNLKETIAESQFIFILSLLKVKWLRIEANGSLCQWADMIMMKMKIKYLNNVVCCQYSEFGIIFRPYQCKDPVIALNMCIIHCQIRLICIDNTCFYLFPSINGYCIISRLHKSMNFLSHKYFRAWTWNLTR